MEPRLVLRCRVLVRPPTTIVVPLPGELEPIEISRVWREALLSLEPPATVGERGELPLDLGLAFDAARGGPERLELTPSLRDDHAEGFSFVEPDRVARSRQLPVHGERG